MQLFSLLFLLFVVTPFVELALLLQLSAVIGGWETLGVVIVTGIVGSAPRPSASWGANDPARAWSCCCSACLMCTQLRSGSCGSNSAWSECSLPVRLD